MLWLSRLLSLLVTVYLLVLVLKNPMLFDLSHIQESHTHDGFSGVRDTIFTRYTGVTVQKHSATRKETTSDSTDMRVTTDKTVHDYIITDVLEQSAENIANDKVSPMHKIMLLMGCYGDRWRQGSEGIHDLLKLDFMMPSTSTITDAAFSLPDRRPLFVNFMLQALEYAANHHTVSNETWGHLATIRMGVSSHVRREI